MAEARDRGDPEHWIGSPETHGDVNLLKEAIHDAVSKTVWRQTRRRPMVIPVITEI